MALNCLLNSLGFDADVPLGGGSGTVLQQPLHQRNVEPVFVVDFRCVPLAESVGAYNYTESGIQFFGYHSFVKKFFEKILGAFLTLTCSLLPHHLTGQGNTQKLVRTCTLGFWQGGDSITKHEPRPKEKIVADARSFNELLFLQYRRIVLEIHKLSVKASFYHQHSTGNPA